MEEFNEQLKNNLENRPEPDFDEKAWDRLAKKLDGSKKFWSPLFFILPAILLLLGGSNIWFLHELKQAQKNQSNLVYVTDTVVQTQIINTVDTVFKNVYIRNSVSENLNTESPKGTTSSVLFRLHDLRRKIEQSNFNINSNELAAPDKSGSSSLNLPVAMLWKKFKANAIENYNNQFVKWIPTNDKLSIKSSQLVVAVIPDLNYERVSKEVKFKRKSFNLARAIKPKEFFIGPSGGPTFINHKELIDGKGYATGLKFALGFSKSLRFWAEGSYATINFLSTSFDDKFGVPFRESPASGYSFKAATVTIPSFQIDLGIKYVFLTEKNFSPYFGLGYSANSPFGKEISYEFEHEIFDQDILVDENLDPSSWSANNIVLNSGFELKINDPLLFQVEGAYHHNTNTNSFFIPNSLGLKGSILFKF